jgi:hypothetical protein
MEATDRISIGAIIRGVIAESENVEPREIAETVVSRIAEPDMRGYFLDLIAQRVSSEAGYLRAQSTPARKSLSTKQALIRDEYWPSFLNQVISLPHGYKKLADATVDDLNFIAQMRRTASGAAPAESQPPPARRCPPDTSTPERCAGSPKRS